MGKIGAAERRKGLWGGARMEMLEMLFRGVCHQIPERAIAAGGLAMPACARCAGFYAGFALALPCFFLAARKGRISTRAFVGPACAAALAWAADGGGNALGVWQTANIWRYAGGMAVGLLLSPFVVSLFKETVGGAPGGEAKAGWYAAAPWPAGLLLVAANVEATQYSVTAGSVAAVIGLVMLLVVMHSALLTLVLSEKRKGVALACSFVTAAGQIAALSSLRGLVLS